MSAAEIRRASTTAGIALLVMALLSAFGYLLTVQRLVVDDNAVQTAANIAGSQTQFRLGIAGLLVVGALDVVVAWALFTVLEPVSKRLSMLAAWFRVAYGALFVVAIAQLSGVLRLLPEAGGAGVSAQVLTRIHAYEDIWSAGLLLFAFHLVLLGVLAYRSWYVPTIVGILLAVAGLGYAVDSFGVVMFPGYAVRVAAVAFVGEVVLIFWLLLRGRRLADEVVTKERRDQQAVEPTDQT